MKKKKVDIDRELNDALEAPDSETKIRITTWIGGDVYLELKKRAKSRGMKYQTLLDQVLRDSLFPEEEKSIEKILERLDRLEKKAM